MHVAQYQENFTVKRILMQVFRGWYYLLLSTEVKQLTAEIARVK